VVTVGEGQSCDLRLVDVSFEGTTSRGRVLRDGAVVGDLVLRIPGRHYLLDALAALAVGLRLGHDAEGLLGGLADFTGTGRRMELKGEASGVRVYDSYAHHPREIAADLEAARAVAGEGRVVAAFQPHLVSRTRIFGAGMGEALGAADEVVVLDVYLAREDADPEVTGAAVAAAVPLPGERVAFVADFDAVPVELVARARPGDVVLTLGAGTVTQLGPRVLALLAAGADRG
jgi:UDP-N-acetylmuramate--alanine ligase